MKGRNDWREDGRYPSRFEQNHYCETACGTVIVKETIIKGPAGERMEAGQL